MCLYIIFVTPNRKFKFIGKREILFGNAREKLSNAHKHLHYLATVSN